MQKEFQTKVQDTNQEAMASKISAIRAGYIQDQFAEEFSTFKGKRDIIMHRGYWARVHLIKKLVKSMVDYSQNPQIISLGCGLDTLWFNMAQSKDYNRSITFIEMDLPEVVSKKIKKIQKSKKIGAIFQELGLKIEKSVNQTQFFAENQYKLISCDLSDLQQFKKCIQSLGIDPKRPTFIYCECVLSYIDPDKVDELLIFIRKHFQLCYFFDYEMYNPNDRFGEMMIKNFAIRGCPLIGIHKYPTLEDQNSRFDKTGFNFTEVYDMAKIYYDCIEKKDRLQIEKLEMLDELEEWNLIMSHYFALLSYSSHNNEQLLNKNKDLHKYIKLHKQ